MKTKIKLLKCRICNKYPFVEESGKDLEKRSTLKIFCSHSIYEGKNHKEVAGNWNIYNEGEK